MGTAWAFLEAASGGEEEEEGKLPWPRPAGSISARFRPDSAFFPRSLLAKYLPNAELLDSVPTAEDG